MNQYVILRSPGHNQVFFQNSGHLSIAELELTLPSRTSAEECQIAGLSYLKFTTAEPLSPSDLEKVATLSATYGLFQQEGDCLRPILLPDPQVFHRSLGTILKYSGKTNEIFTRMLLNIALATGKQDYQGAKILDPVAGRGTTLFEAFALGADVYGMEIAEKSVSEGYQHLKKFLEKGKHKHKTNSIRFSGPNKSFTAKRYTIDCDKQHFELVSGDSKYCEELFSQNFFHAIVGDLPYGVQHGNHSGGLSRSPAQLLATCGQAWYKCLKKGGVLVLSWNTLVLPKEKLWEILEKQGFQIQKEAPFDGLGHPVDNSIFRDIVVAKKT